MSTALERPLDAAATVAAAIPTPPLAGREATFKIANTRAEREAAFRLVYHSYLRSGLGRPNPYGMRATPYQLVPGSEIFIAQLDREVIATMSLVVDSPLGLPMEGVFPEEIAAQRRRGLRLSEVTCLADRRADPRRFLPLMLELSRIMAQYARRSGLDALLIAVHPTHARFYRRYMNFTPISDERDYPSVQNRPAVAMCLEFGDIDERRPQCYGVCLARALPPEAFNTSLPTPEELADYRRIAEWYGGAEPACTSDHIGAAAKPAE